MKKFISEMTFVVLIVGLIVAGTMAFVANDHRNNQETALAGQLAKFRGQFLVMMPPTERQPFGTDVTCGLAFLVSAQTPANDLPKGCVTDILKNDLDPYGKPVPVQHEPGIPNAFGGRTSFFVVDDKDNFQAYATKVPADVCAKFDPGYLRCVDALPNGTAKQFSSKKNQQVTWTLGDGIRRCRLDANNNAECTFDNTLPPTDAPTAIKE